MARLEENGGRVLESDVFTPMSRLVIRPEPKLNALVLVGTPMNLEVVTELIGMLDIEYETPLDNYIDNGGRWYIKVPQTDKDLLEPGYDRL